MSLFSIITGSRTFGMEDIRALLDLMKSGIVFWLHSSSEFKRAEEKIKIEALRLRRTPNFRLE